MTLIPENDLECAAYDNLVCVHTYVCTRRAECTKPGADLVLNICKCIIYKCKCVLMVRVHVRMHV